MSENLYFGTSEADNLDALKVEADSSIATPSNVKLGFGYKDALSREYSTGTMPINTGQDIKIDPYENSNSYTIPLGYHSGSQKIYTGTLDEYTQATATKEDIVKDKTAWINGQYVVGTLNKEESEQIANATENDIVEGKTAWVLKNKILGKIPKLFRKDKTLLAGESYTYPYGLSPGTSVISAATLASQTPGTATPDTILEGEIAWSNGEKIVGTYDIHDTIVEVLKDTDASKPMVLSGKKFYSNIYQMIVSGTMPDHTGEDQRVIEIGQTFNIPEGYYNGQSSIRTKSLYDATIASAVAKNILVGKTAYTNGEKITGTMVYNDPTETIIAGGATYIIAEGYHTGNGKVIAKSSAEETKGTALPRDILKPKTAWVNGIQITGTMEPVDTTDKQLAPGEVYTIPEGYHTGVGIVWTKGLDELTLANATPDDLLEGKTAWVNGEKITGTIDVGNIVQLRILVGHNYQIPPGYYPLGVKVYCLYEPPVLDLDGTEAYWKELGLYPETAGYVDGKQLIITDNPL